LCDRARSKRSVSLAVGKQLTALGFRRLQVAPATPEGGRGGGGGTQRNFPEAVAAALPEAAKGKPLEIWFQE
jgi:hypothetical protein